MTWHPDGFLRKWGVLGLCGRHSGAHVCRICWALAGAMFLGRRKSHTAQQTHEPVNVPYVIIGTGGLWFGWFGFNAGLALGVNATTVSAFANTNTAAAAAMLAWVFFEAVRGHKVSAIGACVGAVVGLVAITPACGFVNIGQSIFIGGVSAIISNIAVHWKNKTSLDDTLDVFPCHGVGGLMGMIFTAVFGAGVGLVYGETTTFVHHIVAIFIVGIFTFAGSMVLYKITDAISPMCVTQEEEELGLDISQHGEVY